MRDFVDEKIYNGSLAEPNKNPKAPIHIITASEVSINISF
jgi:hypothetical protein